MLSLKVVQLPFKVAVILLIIVGLFGCEDDTQESVVLTEEVLLLSGERGRLSGRIYSIGGGEASQHGFEISTSSEFSNPILIELGPRTELGSFIGESNLLSSNTEYYYRAFALIGGTTFYGETKSFSTLSVSVRSYEPKTAYPGDKMTIIGANFSSSVRIFFGDQEAQINEIDLEAIMELTIPPIGSSTIVTVRVEDVNSEITLDEPFEYVFGEWSEVEELPYAQKLDGPISMVYQDHFILGMGVEENPAGFNRNFWKYDPGTEAWTQFPYFSTVVENAFSNDEGYFGGGGYETEGGLVFVNQFWQLQDESFTYLGDIPFGIHHGVSFTIGNSIYVVGGIGGGVDGVSQAVQDTAYVYDISTGTWSVFDDNMPFLTTNLLPHFRHGDLEYFITEDEQIWTFDRVNETWNFVGDAAIDIREGGFSEVIGDKAYIGLFTLRNQIWEYDIVNNSWKEKTLLLGDINSKNIGAFVNNGLIRVVRSDRSAIDSNMVMWEFDPEAF